MALETTHKVGIGVIVVAAVGFLIFSAPREGVLEYVYVDEVVARAADFTGREFRVHGTVVPGTVKQKKNTTADYTFEIEREGKRLAVHYTDMVPDTFMEGGEVVLTGTLTPDGGTFESSEMSAKCPSKYEEENGVKLEGEAQKS